MTNIYKVATAGRSVVAPLRRLLIGASVASSLMLAPATADAQTRVFQVCFTTGVGSCTTLELTTTAFFSGADRIGTSIDVLVRYDDGVTPGSAVSLAG